MTIRKASKLKTEKTEPSAGIDPEPVHTLAEVSNLDNTGVANIQRTIEELLANVHDSHSETDTGESSPIGESHDKTPLDDSGTAEGRVMKPENKRHGRPQKENTVQKQKSRDSVEATRQTADADEVAKVTAALGELYSLEAVAAALGCTSRTVQSYLKSGRLRGVKVAGVWKITPANLRRFIEGE